MAFRAIFVAVLSTVPIAGCGTVVNLAKPHPESGGRIPFGGVRQDVACIENAANGESIFGGHSEPELPQHRRVAHMLWCAADLPLSAVGDVVTWPYTASYTFINQPIPVPPVTPAPTLPPQQGPATAQPGQTYPEVLPEPRVLPPPSKEPLPEPKEPSRPLKKSVPNPTRGQPRPSYELLPAPMELPRPLHELLSTPIELP